MTANRLASGFQTIFGSSNNSHERQKPLIETVDTALTSAGEFHSKSFFLRQLEQTGRVSLGQLKKLAVGDLGSALIRDEKITGKLELEERFNRIVEQLPGIRLAHYQDIAQRGAVGETDGPAGVILLALNGNKANIVLNCVRHRAVSFLVVDYQLADKLKTLLPAKKR